MDLPLEQLARRAEAQPGDEALARQLDRELRRSGQAGQLTRRYQVKFLCPLAFEELTPTEQQGVRRCERCQRSVTFTRDAASLAASVAEGACVAVPGDLVEQGLVALADDERLHTAEDETSPCLVGSQLEVVSLSAEHVQERALERFPLLYARRYDALPLEFRPPGKDDVKNLGALRVAFALPPPRTLLDQLEGWLRVPLEPVLAAEPARLEALRDECYPDDEPELMGLLMPVSES